MLLPGNELYLVFEKCVMLVLQLFSTFIGFVKSVDLVFVWIASKARSLRKKLKVCLLVAALL